MGKGDRRSRKGKINMGSFGKSRPKTSNRVKALAVSVIRREIAKKTAKEKAAAEKAAEKAAKEAEAAAK